MKKIVHRRKVDRKLHPWLVLSGSVAGVALVVAVGVYLIAGRSTPEKRARRLTRGLVESIGQLDWEGLRRKMGVPETVDASKFESYITRRYEILVDREPVLIPMKVGKARAVGEDVYEVGYGLRFRYERTDRRTRAKGLARWRYDEDSGSMSYIIEDEMKEALGIE